MEVRFGGLFLFLCVCVFSFIGAEEAIDGPWEERCKWTYLLGGAQVDKPVLPVELGRRVGRRQRRRGRLRQDLVDVRRQGRRGLRLRGHIDSLCFITTTTTTTRRGVEEKGGRVKCASARPVRCTHVYIKAPWERGARAESVEVCGSEYPTTCHISRPKSKKRLNEQERTLT